MTSTSAESRRSPRITDHVSQALGNGRTSIEFALREIDGAGDYCLIGSRTLLSLPRLAIAQ